MLDPFSRGTIGALTALCVLGAVELTPLPARSFFRANTPREPRLGPAWESTLGRLPIRRDPFAEPDPARDSPATAPAAHTPALAATGTGGALPGNLMNEAIPGLPGAAGDADGQADPNVASPPGARSRISAIVTGAHPFALVESAGKNEIKGIGDRVDGIPIVAIGIDGLRLQNGQRLSVDPGTRP